MGGCLCRLASVLRVHALVSRSRRSLHVAGEAVQGKTPEETADLRRALLCAGGGSPMPPQGKTALLGQPDFVLETVCEFLGAQPLAVLRRCSARLIDQVGSEEHVAALARARWDRLPGVSRFGGILAKVKSLEDLRLAERPFLQATLHVFGFASSRPHWSDETSSTLDAFAAMMKEYPEARLKIEGHGQPGAPEPIASTLAWQRAENVSKEFQMSYGVLRDRMDVTHKSNQAPRFSNPDLNRRVELSLLDCGGGTSSATSTTATVSMAEAESPQSPPPPVPQRRRRLLIGPRLALWRGDNTPTPPTPPPVPAEGGGSDGALPPV